MKGYIYKFTILTTGTYYVGQHFSSKKFERYWGSGRVWENRLKYWKRKYPTCWQKLIKREILWSGECTQKLLDKLEEVYIRKEKALKSDGCGGCNILPGTSNKFGSGSPMNDPEVVKKVSKSMKKFFKEHPDVKEEIHRKRRWALENTDYKQRISNTLKGRYSGEKNPNYGNYWTDEQKEALSKKMVGRYDGKKNPNYGNKWSEEKKNQLSKKLHERTQSDGYVNPMQDKVRITNGSVNTIISKDAPLPEGYWYGMTRGVRKKKKYEN